MRSYERAPKHPEGLVRRRHWPVPRRDENTAGTGPTRRLQHKHGTGGDVWTGREGRRLPPPAPATYTSRYHVTWRDSHTYTHTATSPATHAPLHRPPSFVASSRPHVTTSPPHIAQIRHSLPTPIQCLSEAHFAAEAVAEEATAVQGAAVVEVVEAAAVEEHTLAARRSAPRRKTFLT